MFSSINSAASLADARNAYRDQPELSTEAQQWLEPHDESYLPYGYCTDIDNNGSFAEGTFEVKKLEDKVAYYWQNKDETDSWIDHYHCKFRIIRVSYEVTCGNKLKYSGAKYLLSDTWKKNEAYSSSDESKAFEASAYDWVELPLSSLKDDGTIVDANGNEYSHAPRAFDKTEILNAWKAQRVDYPTYTFQGKPGLLPRPVLLVHGINSDFKVFGAYPLKTSDGEFAEKGTALFQSANVSGYMNGSLPDILARNQNLDNTEAGINSNGIYFFQSPGAFDSNGDWKEVKPHWNSSNAKTSQSMALYERLAEVLTKVYGDAWKTEDWAKIDLVCHSQGGLVVREMLRGLNQDKSVFPEGNANAANHINQIITVDTPHFGSPLAGDAETAERDYPGLGRLLEDLDNSVAGTASTRTLISADVDVDFMERVGEGANAGASKLAGWQESDHWYSGLTAVVALPLGILGGTGGGIAGAFTDVTLKVKGPYFGPYVVEIYQDIPGPWNSTSEEGRMEGASGFIEKYLDARYGGEHLNPKSSLISTLKKVNENGYPTLPNGNKVTMRPLYSEDTRPLLGTLFSELANGADRLCAENSTEAGCFALGDLMRSYVSKSRGYDISNVDFNDDLWSMLTDLQDNWFSVTDAVVPATSQKFTDEQSGLTPDSKLLAGVFKNPRSFVLHDALAPWEALAHGPFKIKKSYVNDLDAIIGMDNQGTSRQGLDLVCALYEKCDISLNSTSKPVYLAKRADFSVATSTTASYAVSGNSVKLSGDFDVTPIFVSSGYQGIAIEDHNGTQRLVTGYIPDQGTYVWYKDDAGVTHSEVLVSGAVATQPKISRKGTLYTVSAVNYSGKTKEVQLPLNISSDVTLSVLANKGSALTGVIVGTATPTDISSQQPPTPPASLGLVTPVRVYHREARADGESNTSRPRILVQNVSGHDISGFKVAYYFSADSKRKPVVELDYPNDNVSLEYISGDLWRFVIDQRNVVLKADDVVPSTDGWQLRLHYQDWAEWISKDDYSANYNIGIAKVNPKIVVYDNSGNVIWGKEPAPYAQQTSSVIPEAQAKLVWQDAVPSDYSTFKPMATVSNVGSVSLENYHALVYFRVPEGKTLVAPVSDWYTPESQPSVKYLGNNVWELDLYFNEHILYGGQSVTESNIGLHLSDWSSFDKTILGIALVDGNNQVIYGARWSGDSDASISDGTEEVSEVDVSELEVSMKLETNASNHLKPRLRIYNNSNVELTSFNVQMKFKTEYSLVPILDIWYVPGCTSKVNSQSDSDYQLTFECSSVNVSPGSYWPDESGAAFGLHYADWSNWDRSNDASFKDLSLDWTVSTGATINSVQ